MFRAGSTSAPRRRLGSDAEHLGGGMEYARRQGDTGAMEPLQVDIASSRLETTPFREGHTCHGRIPLCSATTQPKKGRKPRRRVAHASGRAASAQPGIRSATTAVSELSHRAYSPKPLRRRRPGGPVPRRGRSAVWRWPGNGRRGCRGSPTAPGSKALNFLLSTRCTTGCKVSPVEGPPSQLVSSR